jgi:tetratricopeptide (TPR) repeat protein/tRNA A-37 threonylcarbamoyl transferase component Bud32
MIGQIISHYKVLERLGEGGMGVVYKAEDTKLKRTVALKFLPQELTRNAEAKERFVREARTASVLDHPNVCTVYEIDESGGHTFISMACIEGQDLKEKIEAGPLDLVDALDIAFQVALGLQAAHEKGVFHRDLKSGNVRITPKGQAKIMDFGLAKSQSGTTITKSGTTMGTPAYMSPEQARGEPVDHRADIWSLGVVLYEMVTGKTPFQGEHEQAVIYSILNREPAPITSLRKEIPGSLNKTIAKSLSKDPAHRYQSVDELLIDLLEAKKDLATGRGAFPGMDRKRRKRRAVVLSAFTVLALAAIVLLLDHTRKPLPTVISRVPIGVMFFDNQTGEDRYDYLRKVLAELLITDLGQSRFLQVMTFPRMHELLRSQAHEGVEVIDAALGFELCKSAGVRVMVLGSLMKSGDTFAMNAQLLDVGTKEQVAAYRVTGRGEDSILGHLVDDLTNEIKEGLEISARETQEERKNISELTTTSLEAYRYYSAGREAAFRMYTHEAIENLQRAIAFDSSFIEAYRALAREYYTLGDKVRALEIIEKAKSVPARMGEEKLTRLLASEAMIKEDWDEAIEHLDRLIKMNPENIGAHNDLGFVYYRQKGMYEEGISEFKKVLKLDPRGITHHSSFTYSFLGWAYLRKGEFAEAREAFNKYVDLLPNQVYPLDCLGDFHLIAGNYDDAIAILRRALEMRPDYSLTHVLLGETYLAKGMFDQASRSYERYRDLSASQVEKAKAHFYLSKPYYLTDDFEGAIRLCERALDLHPDLIEARWVRGLAYVKTGMLTRAEGEVLTIQRLTGKSAGEDMTAYDWHLQGELLLARGLHQEGLENFKKAAEIRSLDRTFFMNALGEAYFSIGELDSAVGEFEAVLKMNSNYAQSHFLLGKVYEEKGLREKARQHFQRFVEIWSEADEGLGQLIEAKKRLEAL